jgi:hypothetical protein
MLHAAAHVFSQRLHPGMADVFVSLSTIERRCRRQRRADGTMLGDTAL